MKLNTDKLLKLAKETHPFIYNRLVMAYENSKEIGEEEWVETEQEIKG